MHNFYDTCFKDLPVSAIKKISEENHLVEQQEYVNYIKNNILLAAGKGRRKCDIDAKGFPEVIKALEASGYQLSLVKSHPIAPRPDYYVVSW